MQEFEDLIGIHRDSQNITISSVLGLIEEWTDDEGKEIIRMIKQRNYYKRILTIHSHHLQEEGKMSLLGRFRRVYSNREFQDKFQERIRVDFANYLNLIKTPRVSLLATDRTDKTLLFLSEKKSIICDCPEPIYGSSEQLRFIPEPKRLQKNYFIRLDIGVRVSEVWNQVYFKLMDIASKGRVFCHPEIRDTLMAALGPEGIEDSLKQVIKDFE